MRLNYIIIPAVTVIVSVAGGYFSRVGLVSWYGSINKPSFTPPGSVIGAVWTAIFILSTISALIVWNSYAPWGTLARDARFWWIAGIFLLNALLNVFWSFLFFYRHEIYAAFWEAVALDLTVIALCVMIRPISQTASVLLWPYAGWGAFASYLTYAVWGMNRA
jgi:tryptophan-rich sensory protein